MFGCWLAMCENVNEGYYNPGDAHVLQTPLLFCLHTTIGWHQSSNAVALLIDLITGVALICLCTSLSLFFKWTARSLCQGKASDTTIRHPKILSEK